MRESSLHPAFETTSAGKTFEGQKRYTLCRRVELGRHRHHRPFVPNLIRRRQEKNRAHWRTFHESYRIPSFEKPVGRIYEEEILHELQRSCVKREYTTAARLGFKHSFS